MLLRPNGIQQGYNKHNVCYSEIKNTMTEKRKIESAAELVNALELGVGVESEFFNKVQQEKQWRLRTIQEPIDWIWRDFVDIKRNFRYAEPVEVVELWGYYSEILDRTEFLHTKLSAIKKTHKQTQIIQNDSIIWTKTEKI